MQGAGGQPWLDVSRRLHGAQGQMFENSVHQQGPSCICGTELAEEESLLSPRACSADILSSLYPPYPGPLYPLPTGWSLRCTGVFIQAEERPIPLPSDGSQRQRYWLRLRENPEDILKGRSSLRHPQFQKAWEGVLLTRWPQSCPPPSPHSSGHGLPGPPATLTHSSNSPLRS